MFDLRLSSLRHSAAKPLQPGTSLLLLIATALWAMPCQCICLGGEELLIRAVVDGRTTSLYEKVVVVSAKAAISNTPDGRGEPIEPFAIFFRLKTDDGQVEKNGFVRVGKSDGQPIGWIKKTDVKSWNTRFVLEPLQPVPGRTFTVDLGQNTKAELDTVAEGKRRFALITQSGSTSKNNNGDETDYPVVVYAGNVQALGAGGTLVRERNQLSDLKLEVMFVIESTDFMLEPYDGVILGDAVKQVITQAVDAIRNNQNLKDAVRLGFVEYQDTSKEATFDSRLTCPLTSNLDEVLSKLNNIASKKINGDWPEAGLAGLSTAVQDAGWADNSSKHIILLGSASYQIYGKREGLNQFGGNYNSFTRSAERYLPEFDSGWNSTGLTIQQLISRAHPQGGSDADKARSGKTFHTILVGKQLPQISPEFEKLSGDIVKSDDTGLQTWFEAATQKLGDEAGKNLIVLCFKYQLIRYQQSLASQQYKQVSQNDGVDGLFLKVEPKAADIKRGAEEISKKLDETFATLEGVRSNKIDKEDLKERSNELTRTFYAIVGAAADKFKNEPVLNGNASDRDNRGREVAQKKVLVSKVELQRLRSSLDAIHKKFQARVAKADRQDTAKILAEIQQITAQTGAGQSQFAADAKLKDVITDLPLRTTILETTPRDIAVMDSETFKQWLNKIEAAIFRVDDLLGGNAKAEWLELSSVAQNDRFTFLRLNELP